jgi:hypothetical protein
LALAAVDILADAEGVLGQEEDARDDVAHQRLAAERHGEAQHREPAISGVMLTPSCDSTR